MRTGATQRTQFTPKIELVINAVTYNNHISTGVLREFKEDAQLWGGVYTATLDNYDDTLKNTDFTGLSVQVLISFDEEAGSYLPLLTVESQAQTSYKGRHAVELTMYDEVARLAMYRGSVGGSLWNHPQQTSAALADVVLPSKAVLPPDLITAISAQSDKTVDEIVTAVVGATTGVTLNSVDADTYRTSQKPLINARDARETIAQALSGTLSYIVPKTNTTELNLIKPTAHASVYTYAGTDYFFSDVVGLDVVTPNTIVYHGILASDSTTLISTNSGAGTGVNAASVSKIGTITEHHDYDPMSRENSGTQLEVDDKGALAIAKLERGANTGILIAPMHCSQELGDAITITDDSYSPSKTITGYVYRIIREFGKGVYTITLFLGGMETGYTPLTGEKFNINSPVQAGDLSKSSISTLPGAVQGFQHNINFQSTAQATITFGAGTVDFHDGTSRTTLATGSPYTIPGTSVRYIYFDLDDANPDVLKFTDDYNSVISVYTGLLAVIQKGSTASINATLIPSSGKTPLITPDVIHMAGVTAFDYGTNLVIPTLQTSEFTAGFINLTASTNKNGNWYDESGVIISALSGIDIYGTDMAFTTSSSVGSISAFADAGGGDVTVTSTGHGLPTGAFRVHISGTTNYDGNYVGTYVGVNTFTIIHSWDGDDATGTLRKVESYVSSAGVITAGAGSVLINDLGITIEGSKPLLLYTGASTQVGAISGTGAGFIIAGSASYDITISGGGDIILAPTGSVNVSTKQIINVVDPTSNQHAATKKYVDDIHPSMWCPAVRDAGGTSDYLMVGNIPVVNVPQNQSAAMSFFIPSNFGTLVAAKVVLIGALSTDPMDIEFYSDYATTLQPAITTHGGGIDTAALNIDAGEFLFVDVSGILGSLAIGDAGGILVHNNDASGNSVYVVGLILEYQVTH